MPIRLAVASMIRSYWEYKTWLSNTDFTIVGSGIVGLNCALHLKQRFPEATILVLEKGFYRKVLAPKMQASLVLAVFLKSYQT